jgi:hypothetical protein
LGWRYNPLYRRLYRVPRASGVTVKAAIPWAPFPRSGGRPVRQRGPKSRDAGLTLVPTDGRRERSSPPPCLSPAEAEQWMVYTGALPSDWFPAEVQPLLIELCQAIPLSQRCADELRGIKSLEGDESLRKFGELLRLKLGLSALIMQLSTKMRLTVQSRLTSRRASALAETARHPKPWDLVSGDGVSDDPADESEPPDWGPRRKN